MVVGPKATSDINSKYVTATIKDVVRIDFVLDNRALLGRMGKKIMKKK